MARPTTHGKLQAGFGYLAVLFIAVMLGIASTATYEQIDTINKREREEDWLFVGLQYKQAIKRYYLQSPQGIRQLPMRIEDLLKDSRYIVTQRYLRKPYLDPLTGQPWQLLLDEGNHIIGVVSGSQGQVLQLAKIETQIKNSKENQSTAIYADFRFVLDKAELNAGAANAGDAEDGLAGSLVENHNAD